MLDHLIKEAGEKTSGAVLEVLDFIGLPAFVVNEDSSIATSNAAALAGFSYSGGELSGKHIGRLIPGLAEGRPSGPAGKFRGVCTRKDGESFSAQVYVVAESDGGKTLVVVQDVTERERLEERSSQRTKELNAFNALTSAVGRSMDIDSIAGEAVSMMLDVMDVDGGWMYLVDERTGELNLRARKGLTEKYFDGIEGLRPGEHFSGRVALSGRPLMVKRAAEDPRVDRARVEEAGVQSIAGVPVTSKGKVLGVLGVASRKPDNFTSMDMKLLATLGNHIGIAVESASLFGKLTEKMQQIGLINEAAGIINSSLSIGTVFRLLASETRKLVRYDRASVDLVDAGGKAMHIFALDTNMNTRLKRGVKAPVEGTGSGWVIKNNKPWINRDLSEEITFPLDERLFKEGIRSTISVPLYHGRMLGAFNLDSTSPGSYSEKDLEILIPVARHISVAVENAMLFEAMSREKKEWEKTFDAITDMVWIQGPGRKTIRANRTVLTRVGKSYKDIAGESCDVILGGLGIDPCQCPCPKPADCQSPTFREISGVSGSTFHFWTYPLLDDDGRQFALVNYCKDVTEQKKLEQHIMRSDKLASLGTLAAGIAHEINNPMGIIAGYAEALIDRSRDEGLLAMEQFADFPEYLETINNEIFRCKGILEGLLYFARPSGWSPRELDINDILKEVLLLVRHRAEKADQDIALELSPGLPTLKAEPGQLRQLFMNLIFNSLYFMPRGGTVTVKTRLSADGRYVETAVCDTGSGIQKDIIHKIFDPFFTTKPVSEGTGLGLAICHRIAENHDGKIEVQSALGKGTTFVVSLPAAG